MEAPGLPQTIQVPASALQPGQKKPAKKLRHVNQGDPAPDPNRMSTAGVPESDDVWKIGWLEKQGGRVKSWKSRWCVLHGYILDYYKKQDDQMPVGRVNMVGSDVLITNDMDKKRQTIRVTAMFSGNKRASYKFVAETPEETINWVDCMAKAAASGRAGGKQEALPSLKANSGIAAFNPARMLVSKKKVRYQEDGFDLDLTFITDRMIAMGFPADKFEAMYRNPINEVIRFLELKHHRHYKLYNLCSERVYPPNKFKNRVASFPFDDHTAPTMALMIEFCQNLDKWYAADERNISCIHCKAGKGRTGVLCSAYLLHQGKFSDADEALTYYGEQRTANGKGVTIPSQIRYVYYYEDYLRTKRGGTAVPLLLERVNMSTTPKIGGSYQMPPFRLLEDNEGIFTSVNAQMRQTSNADGTPGLDYLCGNVPVTGDIRIEFFHENKMICYASFNTAFVGGNCLTLTKSEIDKAHKDSKKKFKEDFELSFFFNRPAGDMSPSSPFVQGGAALQAQAVPAASATSLPGQPVMTWEPDSLPNVADMSSDEEDEDNMPADGGYGFSSSAFVTDDGFEEDDDDDDIDGGAETLI